MKFVARWYSVIAIKTRTEMPVVHTNLIKRNWLKKNQQTVIRIYQMNQVWRSYQKLSVVFQDHLLSGQCRRRLEEEMGTRPYGKYVVHDRTAKRNMKLWLSMGKVENLNKYGGGVFYGNIVLFKKYKFAVNNRMIGNNDRSYFQ